MMWISDRNFEHSEVTVLFLHSPDERYGWNGIHLDDWICQWPEKMTVFLSVALLQQLTGWAPSTSGQHAASRCLSSLLCLWFIKGNSLLSLWDSRLVQKLKANSWQGHESWFRFFFICSEPFLEVMWHFLFVSCKTQPNSWIFTVQPNNCITCDHETTNQKLASRPLSLA